MRQQVTIIPADAMIIVDGQPLSFAFAAPSGIHAVQWRGTGGHIEYADGKTLNKDLSGQDDYTAHVASFVALWEIENARLEAEANRPPTLEEAKVSKIIQIDAEISATILAGFDYTVDGQILHFSYDTNDQQNFADTANASTFAKMGIPGVPETVTWNGWNIEKGADGKELSRALVRLTLTPDSFLALYMGGALTHKATQMEIGGQRKAAAENAATIEELESI